MLICEECCVNTLEVKCVLFFEEVRNLNLTQINYVHFHFANKIIYYH